MRRIRLGLVLSGGGACGAYEVGVLQVLARLGLNPQVVSGASIGALNGAVVASTPRLTKAAECLVSLWTSLDPSLILKPKTGSSFRSLLEAIATPKLKSLTEENHDFFGFFDESPIEALLQQCVNIKRLYRGKDLYISVFSGSQDPGLLGALEDLIHWALSDRRSEFIKIQDFAPREALTLLKASAAIPLFFQAQKVRGRVYRDGGIGDRRTAQGNTPIEPLVAAGCTHAVVITLDDDFQIDTDRFPELRLVVIRPSKSLDEEGIVDALLDFSPDRIKQLIELGRRDAENLSELTALRAEFNPLYSIISRIRSLFTKN